MSVYFKPYEGKRPYLFVSYSHRDSEKVLDTITRLRDAKLRLWYDEGIPAGSDWPKNIEEHMQSCSAVLFFVSETALASPNCRSEIEAALSQNKTVLLLPLAPAQPDEAWKDMLGRCTMLPSGNDASARAEAVLTCRQITRGFFHKPFENFRFDRLALVTALLFFAAAAIGLHALASGRFDRYILPEPAAPSAAPPAPTEAPVTTEVPETVEVPFIPAMEKVTFPDAKQEAAVRSILNRPEGDVMLSDLAGVTQLHFCGTMVLGDLSGVEFTDGAYAVNKAKPAEGPVRDLSLIGRMPYLNTLSLILQPVGSLAGLERVVLLEELSLAGCRNADISTLPVLPSLTVLHLEHGSARDLSALSAQPALKTVTVSADMLPLTFSDAAAFDVVLVP